MKKMEDMLKTKAMQSSRKKEECVSLNYRSHHVSLNVSKTNQCVLWHNRLGHAPFEKLKQIGCIDNTVDVQGVCLTCPMAKFCKLPFNVSKSCATSAFELIHLDVWGPYRVSTRYKHRYFLTIVDDYSRATWVHLMKCKSESFNLM